MFSSSSSKPRPDRHQYIPMTSMETMDHPARPSKSTDTEDVEEPSVRDEAFGDTADLYLPESNDAAIPNGTVDPVYERKARVLNHAVTRMISLSRDSSLTFFRFRKLAWDGTSGNCSLWLDSVGRTTICGQLSLLSSVRYTHCNAGSFANTQESNPSRMNFTLLSHHS